MKVILWGRSMGAVAGMLYWEALIAASECTSITACVYDSPF